MWDAVCRTVSYRFRDEGLLRLALTHRSYAQNETGQGISNERLEFLGDAVLGLVVTEELYRRFPKKSEGELTKMKSLVVSRQVLAEQASKMGLGQHLLLGMGEERSGGRHRKSILSDAYEALVGAVYLDGGLDAVRRFICNHLLRDMHRFLNSESHRNYKSHLLEYVQGKGWTGPEYRVLKEAGPDHEKKFTVEVRVRGETLGRGEGASKKKAEQEAARRAMETLGLPDKKQKTDG